MTCACFPEGNVSMLKMVERLTTSYSNLQMEVIEMRDELAKQKYRLQQQAQIITSLLEEIKRCAT